MVCGDCLKYKTAACTGWVEAGEIPLCLGYSPVRVNGRRSWLVEGTPRKVDSRTRRILARMR